MKKNIITAYIWAALLTTGIIATQASAGILAEGNISVHKRGHSIVNMTGQNPVDEEALLVCNEKCLIKATGVSIAGTEGTELAVKSNLEQFNMLLKKGKLDFFLSGTVGKMGFYTADRQYARADVIYNAGTKAPVRGYMELTPAGDTKIGVYEGRLVFNTAEGAKTVDSNNYILLAQADMGGMPDDEPLPPTEEDDDDDSAALFWVGGATAAGVITWGIYEHIDGDDDDSSASTTSSSGVDSSSSGSSSSGSSSSGSSSSGSSSSGSSSSGSSSSGSSSTASPSM